MGVDIGGLEFSLLGLDSATREHLRDRYAAFPAAGSTKPFRVRLLDAGRDHFVPPASVPQGAPHPLTLGWEGPWILVQSFGFAGWISIGTQEGEMALARSEYERVGWCVENFLRVCTAWRAVEEGGALLHAASLVLDGKAYVFMGASGSGKSTLAASSKKGEVISDDLTLIRPSAEGFRVAGTPFRGTYEGGGPIRGSFPLARLYRIFQSPDNRVEPCPRNHAVADLLAAAPFVVDQIGRDDRILLTFKALDDSHPLAYLFFNLGGEFWRALDVD
ncbi:MAG TPA: hypothetical protein VGR38_08420 [Candidatus Polarisedimenticolia bacterium]|nr:hypothetical protein [Candidatus Polarisedimenticolia bacterium]